MYLEYWQLTTHPFENSDDPRLLYESPGHEEALARLYYLVEEQRLCGVLRGAAGTGKSLLLRVLAHQTRRAQRTVALLDLLGVGAAEFLWRLSAELQLAPGRDDSPLRLWTALQDHLYGLGCVRMPTVVLCDHLERAEPGCLPTLQRLLELSRRPDCCLTVIAATRADESYRSTAVLDRLADLRIELPPLDTDDCRRYVQERIRRAGGSSEIFDDSAFGPLRELSGGVPRELNRLCELCLVAAMGDDRAAIDSDVALAVARDLRRRSEQPLDVPSGAGASSLV